MVRFGLGSPVATVMVSSSFSSFLWSLIGFDRFCILFIGDLLLYGRAPWAWPAARDGRPSRDVVLGRLSVVVNAEAELFSRWYFGRVLYASFTLASSCFLTGH